MITKYELLQSTSYMRLHVEILDTHNNLHTHTHICVDIYFHREKLQLSVTL